MALVCSLTSVEHLVSRLPPWHKGSEGVHGEKSEDDCCTRSDDLPRSPSQCACRCKRVGNVCSCTEVTLTSSTSAAFLHWPLNEYMVAILKYTQAESSVV